MLLPIFSMSPVVRVNALDKRGVRGLSSGNPEYCVNVLPKFQEIRRGHTHERKVKQNGKRALRR